MDVLIRYRKEFYPTKGIRHQIKHDINIKVYSDIELIQYRSNPLTNVKLFLSFMFKFIHVGANVQVNAMHMLCPVPFYARVSLGVRPCPCPFSCRVNVRGGARILVHVCVH
jgi:hypothetical protein